MLVKSDSFLAKLDHHLNPNWQLAFRYNYADGLNENIEPWGGLVARSRGAVLDSRDHMFSVAQTAVLRIDVGQRGTISVRAARPAGEFARSEMRRAMHR